MLGMGVVSLMAAAGAVAAPSPGAYVGSTSQWPKQVHIGFRASGNQIKSETIGWKARCASHKTLARGTRQASTRIVLRHGAWSSHSSYSAKLPYERGMVGNFTVLTDTGRFVTRTTATGTFHLVVTLRVRGKKVDRCDTGRITWKARHT